jgi:hypothetical protein
MEALPCLPVDIIVGGLNIGWLKNREDCDSRMEHQSGRFQKGYHKPGKRYIDGKNTRFVLIQKTESSL